MGRAAILRCFPPTRRASSCVCSTRPTAARSSASRCPNTPTRFSTAGSRASALVRFTAIACTALTSPTAGHRFNPNKLLLDPYAVAHAGKLKWDPACFGYQMETGDDLTFDERDSAPFMPKCVVVDPNFDWKGEAHQAPRPVGSHDHLRDTRARLHTLAHRHSGAFARDLCGPGQRAGHRLRPIAWRQRSSSCCRCTRSSTTSSCSRRV